EAGEASRRAGPCEKHRKLAADEICPKCQARPICAVCARTGQPPACAACATRSGRWRTFRRVRIGILLAILAFVAVTGWQRSRRVKSWSRTLVVAVHPIAGDGSPDVEAHVAGLRAADFDDVRAFFDREASRLGIAVSPVLEISTSPPLRIMPPPAPDLE